jgi:predicted extracellular nuclease
VAGPPERFAKLGRTLVEALGAPAVVALQEVQDDSGPKDDGVVTSTATLAALLHGVEAAGGPRYEAVWIDPENDREGGQPGGNIRVALLADPRRAKVVRRGDAGPLDAAAILSGSRGPTLAASPARVAPTSPAFTLTSGEGVRRSLAVELEVAGMPWFVVVNHWSSKYGDGRDYGATQPPRQISGPNREAQAEVIRSWAESLLRLDPRARVVLLGDFNDYEWSPGVARLSAAPFEDLLLRLPEPDRYSYVFEGAAQLIDHVVVSPALAEGAEVDVVHVNADCADERRTSDHDPVLVRLRER